MGRAFVHVVGAALLSAAAVVAQTPNPSAQVVINRPRALTAAEIAQVLAAARTAVNGRTLRLSYQPGGPGTELLMADDGRPRLVQAVSGYTWTASNGASGAATEHHATVTEVTEFTRRPAKRCDGAPDDGELVIEYRSEDDKGWTAKARTRTPIEFATPVFDMLTGGAALASGERKPLGGRVARAFTAPWQLPQGATPGGPLPPDIHQTLWIDVESLLPLRWELSAATMPAYGLWFTYETVQIRAPEGVPAPGCVQ
jgi:hypothetical protein